MHSSISSRRTVQVAYLLIFAIVATQGACKKKAPTVDAFLIISGGGDCLYQPAVGQQDIYIDMKGTSTSNAGNHFTTTVANVPSSTYSVKVPNQGNFDIAVIVTEKAGNKACQACSNLCASPTTNPKWTGIGHFTGTTATGNSLNVPIALPANLNKADCGC